MTNTTLAAATVATVLAEMEEEKALVARLQRENAELRAALNKIVNNWSNLHPKDLAQARQALATGEKP